MYFVTALYEYTIYRSFCLSFSLMLCNHTGRMPRGDFNIYFASGRGGFVRAEEYVCLFHFQTILLGCIIQFSLVIVKLICNWVVYHRGVGIALLVIILAALLLLGCWYFRKRSGYKLIRVRTPYLLSSGPKNVDFITEHNSRIVSSVQWHYVLCNLQSEEQRQVNLCRN